MIANTTGYSFTCSYCDQKYFTEWKDKRNTSRRHSYTIGDIALMCHHCFHGTVNPKKKDEKKEKNKLECWTIS